MGHLFIGDFSIVRPEFESNQEHTLEWLIRAHIASEEKKRGKEWPSNEREEFQRKIREDFLRVGCKPDRIAKRGHSISDYLHFDWKKMEIYPLEDASDGASLGNRSKAFERISDKVLEDLYREESTPPANLIHVTCTGYLAPSSAQKLISKKRWGNETYVTHAYHMGCHGAVSALKIGRGFAGKTDIVHTEICSLQTNPGEHGLDQMVAQSLFSDGYIKYSLLEKPTACSFKLLSLHETIIPNSISAMTWNIAEWGFAISLAKEIPVHIVRALKEYLKVLASKGNTSVENLLEKARFAVHPGGPKILQQIQKELGLKDSQMENSFSILKNYGNMSSATLPHIWESMLREESISDKELIVSLAFGPGLSICGALMEKKVCG